MKDYPYVTPGDPFQYDLRWIVSQIQTLHQLFDKLKCDVEKTGGNVEALNGYTKALSDAQCAINERLDVGDFEKETFAEWADANLPAMVTQMVKFVFFGLSDDGHFVAYIPSSWKFLNFDTSTRANDPNWGHLIIRY